MALPNAYSQYNKYTTEKIMNASPGELTLLLYEGAIKFCNMAKMGIEHHDIQRAHKNIVKTEDIIHYLRETLDMKYPVAQHFENIYVYLERRLVEANTTKNAAILGEICTHLRSLRETWLEVMRINKGKGTV